jgi:hypothetical protein
MHPPQSVVITTRELNLHRTGFEVKRRIGTWSLSQERLGEVLCGRVGRKECLDAQFLSGNIEWGTDCRNHREEAEPERVATKYDGMERERARQQHGLDGRRCRVGAEVSEKREGARVRDTGDGLAKDPLHESAGDNVPVLDPWTKPTRSKEGPQEIARLRE